MALASLSRPQVARTGFACASRKRVVHVRVAASGKTPQPATPPPEESSSLGKTVLVKEVAKLADITQAEAASAVDAVVSIISQALDEGKRVTIPNFGSFVVRERAERAGRNPSTGEPITIPAAKVPAFKAAEALRDRVNGKTSAPKAKPAAPAAAKPKPAANTAAKAAPKAAGPAEPKPAAPKAAPKIASKPPPRK